MNDLFHASNKDLLADTIIQFRETSKLYDSNITLYLEVNYWEVFDLRCCKVIFRHDYKHLRKLKQDLWQLHQSIMNAGLIKYNNKNGLRISQVWALKFLRKFYNEEELKYFLT